MIFALFLLVVLGQDPLDSFTEQDVRIVLSLTPLPPPPPSPTNEWADHPAAARLGRALFHAPGFSKSGAISCSTCHVPERAFTDGRDVASGVLPGHKNTPTLLNSAYQRFWFWDGRADSLWAQALSPIESASEMGGSRTAALHHVQSDPELSGLWEAAFGPMPDLRDRTRFPASASPPPIDPSNPFATPTATEARHQAWNGMTAADRELVDGMFVRLGKAIEAYERTLVGGNSAFDRFVRGLRTGDEELVSSLSPSGQRGLKLFVDRGNCVSCHFGPQLSDGQFHNIGLDVDGRSRVDDGRSDGIRRVRVDPFNGRGAHSDNTEWSANVKLLTLRINEHVDGAYKTPTLRNVARTAPYFHDGRASTLEEVVRHYSELRGEVTFGHREETLQPLNLTDREVGDLVAFLRALDG